MEPKWKTVGIICCVVSILVFLMRNYEGSRWALTWALLCNIISKVEDEE